MFDSERTATSLSRQRSDHTASARTLWYDYLHVIRRHRWLVVTLLTATLALAVLQTRTSVPQYRARATLLIGDERENFVGVMGRHPALDYYRDPELYAETQYSLLSSVTLGERVAKRLDLTEPIPNATNPLSISALGDTLLTAVAARVRLGAAWLRGSSVTAVEAEAGPSAKGASYKMWAAHIADSVLVLPETDTRLVRVMFASPDPDLAASVVNALVDAYVDLSLELRQGTTTQTVGWIQEELTTQQEMLARSDRALIEYREAEDAFSLDENNDIVTARLAMLNQEVMVAERNRVESESIYRQVRDLDLDQGAVLLEVPVIGQHPSVRDLRTAVATLEAEHARLSRRYGPRHPEMQQLDASIRAAHQELSEEPPRIVAAIAADYQSALHSEQELRMELANQQDRATGLVRKSANYNVLKRVAESDRTIYEMLLQRGKEFEILAHSTANNIQIISYANSAGVALQPRIWFKTIVAGVLLTFGLVFSSTYFNDRVQRPEELTNLFNLPLLGLVPRVRSVGEPSVNDVSLEHFTDAFRTLRTTLTFACPTDDSASRVILVTSAQPGEGKTVTSCNLALMLARGGARVLLVDADLHRAGVSSHLGLPNKKGLAELLQGQISLRDAVSRTQDPNLDVIVAGSPPEKPGELIGGAEMRSLMSHLRESPVSWVIIDTLPVMAVGDVVTLPPMATGVIVVVGEDMTPKCQVHRTLEDLNRVPCCIIGGVLNRFDRDRDKYYNKRYYDDNRSEYSYRHVA